MNTHCWARCIGSLSKLANIASVSEPRATKLDAYLWISYRFLETAFCGLLSLSELLSTLLSLPSPDSRTRHGIVGPRPGTIQIIVDTRVSRFVGARKLHGGSWLAGTAVLNMELRA